MTDFTTFIDKLKIRLQQPLPGLTAHSVMASETRLKLKMPSPNERTRESAVLILFYPSDNQVFIPLILRPQYDGVHGGQMAFPGGRAEKEDEHLERTALREAQEEIGVRVSDITVLGKLTKLFIAHSNFYVQPVVGFMTHKPDFYPDPREVDTPFYEILNTTVWGATAMMVSELLMIIESLETTQPLDK